MQTTRLRSLILAVALITAATLAQAALKPGEVNAARSLFNSNGCTSCHDMSGKSAGPSMRAVAQRYRGKKISTELASRIREGSSGRWGNEEAHPPVGVLEPAEAKLLATWILSGAP